MKQDDFFSPAESKALDCLSHGLAHLISTFGVDRALEIAAALVLGNRRP